MNNKEEAEKVHRCRDCRKQLHGENAIDVGYCEDCYHEMMADDRYDEDNDDEPVGYQCYTCGKSWAKNPGSMPCWDMGCTINEYH